MNILSERLSLAIKLKEKSTNSKIKLIDLANAVGIKAASVSYLLNGKSKSMQAENLFAAAKFLQVDPYWLATGNGSHTGNYESTGTKIPVVKIKDFQNINEGLSTAVSSDYIVIEDHIKNTGSMIAIELDDESMSPNFEPKDILIIDRSLKPAPANFVLVQLGNEILFRQYKVINYDDDGSDIFDLVPLNTFYPPLSNKISETSVIGVLVRLIRKY